MGDRGAEFPDLSQVSTSNLLRWIQLILSELTVRFAETAAPDQPSSPRIPESQGSWEVPSSPGLRSLWRCGFHCRWCDRPCTRAEGHKHHSCYEHRHRR